MLDATKGMNYNQQRVLGLLKEIDGICKPRGIAFYLGAGSMIGAIRHGGFIPWDDDADIYMKRADWKRFVDAFNEAPIPNRVLLDPEITPEACYTIHRYVNVATSELYRYHLASPQPDGLMIDVLVLDDIPDNEQARMEHIKNLTEYSNVLVQATSYSHKCPVSTEGRSLQQRVKREGREAVLADYRQRLFNYPEGMCNHLVQCDAGVPHVWRKEVFDTPRYVPFEDTTMPVATDVFAALTGAFNEDWMYIPSAAEQETHIVTRDYTIGHSIIYNDAAQFFDKDAVNANYVERNWRVIDSAEELKRLNEELNWFSDEYVRMKYIDFDAQEIQQWLEQHNYKKLNEYYSLYFTHQCSKRHIGRPSYAHWYRAHYPTYLDCGDDFLYGALRTLFHNKLLSNVHRILLARVRTGLPLTSELASIEKEYEDTCTLLSAYFLEDPTGAYDLLPHMVKQYPHNPYVCELQLRHVYSSDKDKAFAMAKEHLCQFTGSSLAQKMIGDWYREHEEYKEAYEAYRKLIEQSLDGIVLKELRDEIVADDTFAALAEGQQVYDAVVLSLSGKKAQACALLGFDANGK